MNNREFIKKVRKYINPYPDPFSKVHIPNQAMGNWRVNQFSVDEEDVMLMNLRSAIDGNARRTLPPGTYTRLYNRGVVMSDTPAEAWENLGPVWAAKNAIDKLINGHGVRILINGLGLGFVLKALLTFDQVELIRVIELQPEVIQMIAPRYRGPKVEIVQADALEYRPDKGERFDVVWHDIWADGLHDRTWPQSKLLHRRYGRLTGWQGSWSREYYLTDRRMYR
jgi:hypothetical protein